MTVQVHAGSKTYKPSALSFNVVKVLKIGAKLGRGVVFPNDMQSIAVTTERGAQLVYNISYAGASKGTVLKQAANARGINAVRFKAAYTPSRLDGLVTAVVNISGANGVVRGTQVVRFTVQRRDAILQLKKLSLHVLTPIVRSSGKAKIDTVSARGAYLTYTVVFGPPRRTSVTYSVAADGSGYATIQFPVTYKPARGKKVPAVVTVTAEQGRVKLRQTLRLTVQG
jgi:hypothetical protein